MMTVSNLPPGCLDTDIPGDRPIDRAFDVAMAELERIWEEEGLPRCEDCQFSNDLECYQSAWFYDFACPVIEEEAEVVARELMERGEWA